MHGSVAVVRGVLAALGRLRPRHFNTDNDGTSHRSNDKRHGGGGGGGSGGGGGGTVINNVAGGGGAAAAAAPSSVISPSSSSSCAWFIFLRANETGRNLVVATGAAAGRCPRR